jgi:hypothetical protein
MSATYSNDKDAITFNIAFNTFTVRRKVLQIYLLFSNGYDYVVYRSLIYLGPLPGAYAKKIRLALSSEF